MTQVFLSHSTKDDEFVNRLAADLRGAGLDVWKAPESINPGETWLQAIERGLRTSTHLVLVISPAASVSEWVELEMNTAISLERAGKMTIIPLDYRSCDDVPLFWRSYQWVSFREAYESGVRQLISLLKPDRTIEADLEPISSGIDKPNISGCWYSVPTSTTAFFKQVGDKVIGFYDYGGKKRKTGMYLGTLKEHIFKYEWRWLVDEPLQGYGRMTLSEEGLRLTGIWWYKGDRMNTHLAVYSYLSDEMPSWIDDKDFEEYLG